MSPNGHVLYAFCQQVTSPAGKNYIKPSVILVAVFYISNRFALAIFLFFRFVGLARSGGALYILSNFQQCKKVSPNGHVLYAFCQQVTSPAGKNYIKPSVILVAER